MLAQLQTLAAISRIDTELEELQEELGDLPSEVKSLEREVYGRQQYLDETRQHLHNALHARGNMNQRVMEIGDKQKHLAEQQYNVRNNREFDAITHEVESLRHELRDIEHEIAGTHMAEENLLVVIQQQEEELDAVKEKLSEVEQELTRLSGSHDKETTALLERRNTLLAALPQALLVQYQRIREYHTNTTVKVRRNSCSGCFSAIPPQKLVEIRNLKQMFTCENCGRILHPEDMEIPAA
jgi:uncharacterized protein